MKIKKGIPLIDQHNRYGFWGGKFGGRSQTNRKGNMKK